MGNPTKVLVACIIAQVSRKWEKTFMKQNVGSGAVQNTGKYLQVTIIMAFYVPLEMDNNYDK